MTTDTTQEQIEDLEQERRSLFGRVRGATRRYLNAGIGVVSVGFEKASDFRHETVEKGIDRLAERGQEVRARRLGGLNEAAEASRGMATGLTSQATEMAGSTLDSVAKAARERLHVASSADIEAVAKQVDELNERIDEIIQPVTG